MSSSPILGTPANKKTKMQRRAIISPTVISLTTSMPSTNPIIDYSSSSSSNSPTTIDNTQQLFTDDEASPKKLKAANRVENWVARR